jgi:hypothetical protein
MSLIGRHQGEDVERDGVSRADVHRPVNQFVTMLVPDTADKFDSNEITIAIPAVMIRVD